MEHKIHINGFLLFFIFIYFIHFCLEFGSALNMSLFFSRVFKFKVNKIKVKNQKPLLSSSWRINCLLRLRAAGSLLRSTRCRCSFLLASVSEIHVTLTTEGKRLKCCYQPGFFFNWMLSEVSLCYVEFQINISFMCGINMHDNPL